MERGSLRQVPLRPHGPVDPGKALAHVGRTLPDLDEPERRALALVELEGRPRAELLLPTDEAGDLLHRARKALRRSTVALPANGWCERAERMLSDDLDAVLEPPGPQRLAVHLRHCGRCVEHERRLAQARDSLVRSFVEAHAAQALPEPEPDAAPAADLRIVVHEAAEVAPALEPEPPSAEPETLPEPAVVAEPPLPAAPARERLTPILLGQQSLVWSAMYALAVLLAVASVVLTVLAATGAVERVF